MEVQIGSVNFVTREWEEQNKHESMLTNRYGTWIVIIKLYRSATEIQTDY